MNLNNAPLAIHRMLAIKSQVTIFKYLNLHDLQEIYENNVKANLTQDVVLARLMADYVKINILPNLLLASHNDAPVKVNSRVYLFTNEPMILVKWTLPSMRTCEGRIFVKSATHPNPKLRELLPSACDLKFIRVEHF